MQMRMSKSRVDTYRNCPYNFRLQYIEGFRNVEEIHDEGSPLKKGTELHKIFEDFYDLPAAREIEEPYANNILDILKSFPLAKKEHLQSSDPDQINLDPKLDSYYALQREYDSHLANFSLFNEHMIHERGIESYIPKYRELELYNKEEHFLGIVDRADEKADGTYKVIDYKTGRAGTLKKYLIELGLYKWLFEAETGEDVSEVGIYFSGIGKLRTIELTDEDVEKSLETLHLVRENIENKVFPRKIGFLCNYCSNRQICDLEIDYD